MSKNRNPYDPKKQKEMHKRYCLAVKKVKEGMTLDKKLFIGAKIRIHGTVYRIKDESDLKVIINSFWSEYNRVINSLDANGRKNFKLYLEKLHAKGEN